MTEDPLNPPPDVLRAIDDELTEHVRRRTDDLVRDGLTEADARRRALAEFGDVDAARRDLAAIDVRLEARRGRFAFWQGLSRDFRLAARRLARQPLQTGIMLLTLALGIGAGTAVFSVVDQTILRPPPFRDADRLVDVFQTNKQKTGGGSALTAPEIAGWQEQSGVFERFEGYAPREFDLAGDGEPERIDGRVVTLGLFDMLGVSPVIGRGFRPGDGAPGSERVAIVGAGLWHRRFGGDPSVLGARLLLNDQPHTIVGVMPARFRLLGADEDVWLPIDVNAGDPAAADFFGIARLRRSVPLSEAQVSVDAMAERLQRESPLRRGWYLRLQEKRAAWVDPGNRRMLFLLLGAVGALLLVACANVASLLVGLSARRARETSLRAALGASRGRLMREALAEGVVLGVAGGVLGALLAKWLVAVVVAMAPAKFAYMTTTTIQVDGRVLAVVALAAVTCGVLCALWPALRASGRASAGALRDGIRATSASGGLARGRGVLVAAEIACSVVLLIGALLMARTMIAVYSLEPGFEVDGLVSMHVDLPSDRYPTPASRRAFFADVQGRLRRLAGVSASAITTGVPPDMGGFSQAPIEVEGGVGSERAVLIPFDRVSPTYFGTTRIPLIAGRSFTSEDRDDVAIVSEAVARRFWPTGSAIGRRFGFAFSSGKTEWRTVVGVVGSIAARFGNTEMTMQLYYPWAPPPAAAVAERTTPSAERSYSYQLLVVRAADAAAAVTGIKEAIWAVDSRQPVEDVALGSERFAEAFARQRFVFLSMAVFAATALALAAAGLFGLLSQAVAQRRREIGIRLALGASSGDLAKLILGRGLMLSALGLVVGLATAMALTRYLASMLVGVGPFDAPSFGFTAVLLFVVAALACWIPTRTALRLDPALTLRAE